jgi:predicted Zn-dependent protease
MFDDIRRIITRIAAKYRVDDFEINLSTGDNTSFNIEQRDLTISTQVGVASLGMRLAKKGKLTYASSTVFDEHTLDRVISAALTNLVPTSLKGFVEIPKGKSSDDSDPEVARFIKNPKALQDILSEMVKRTWSEGKGRFERLNGSGAITDGESWIYTSRSKEPSYIRQTSFGVNVDLDSRDFDFLTGRKLASEPEIASLGANLAKSLPKGSLKPSDIGVKGQVVDVILHPMCLQGLFGLLVAEQIYATNKLLGISKYRVGEKLAAPSVTIYDDATHPELLSSSPTDDEGTVSRRIPIFEAGTFKNFLYDAETAVLDKTSSTGSGMRRSVLAEEANEAPVRPTLRSLVMEPGKARLSDMVSSVKKGIMLKFLLGIHTADKVTGAFANTAFLSRVIDGGKTVATTEPGTWAMRGNALELLKNIEEISAERLNLGSGLLPWVKTRLAVG